MKISIFKIKSPREAFEDGLRAGTVVRIFIELLCAGWCARRTGKMARLSALMLTTTACARTYELVDDFLDNI